jgi:hypothetical protein
MRGPVLIKSSRSNMLRYKTAANLALRHMALTFFEETLDRLDHAYSAALLEHTSHQSRLDFSNSGSKL